MSAATAFARRDPRVDPVSSALRETRVSARASTVAFCGICVLSLVAPFETTEPLLRVPGQALSSVEAVLLVAVLSWVITMLATGNRPVLRTPLTLPLAAIVAASLIAALAAPAYRENALHMTGRLALACAAFGLTVAGVTTRRRVELLIVSCAVAGSFVAVVMFLEYGGHAGVLAVLRSFRPGLSAVGAQVRAGGPFQYPTIASMYLEIAFALALGLLPAAVRARRVWPAAALVVALVLMGEAVVLTFTRAGLVTIGVGLVLVGVLEVRRHGFDAGTAVLCAVAAVVVVEVFSSRSIEAVRLRMTTETQDAWYAARIVAPATISLPTGGSVTVPVSVTNTGRVTWQPAAFRAFRFSYHWLAADSDRVVVWEGARTTFNHPVAPGETVTLQAAVRAPSEPGTFRILWDVEQHQQLWFSSEADASQTFTRAVVSGPVVAPIAESPVRYVPKARSRPGRLTLWSAALGMFAAHPWTGVGLDNFRLLYGDYGKLPDADPRVHCNNTYLEVLAGTGIVGALAGAWFAWRALRTAVAAAWHDTSALGAGVLAAAVAIGLHGLVDSFLSFTATYLLMAITAGLSVAVSATYGPHADRV